MLKSHQYFISTYTRALLTDWSLLTNYIHKTATWVKDTLIPDETPTFPALLTTRQINDAFTGPYQQLFKPALEAYLQINTVQTAISISKEDFFKDSEQTEDKFDIPASFLDKIEYTSLKETQNKLNELLKQFYAVWETQVGQWTELLLQACQKNKILLSDSEKNDFATNEPLSELNDRFVNLKITPPTLSKGDLDFEQYFTLKSLLAIQSALNRMQQPNTDKDIHAILKTLKPTLKSVHESENTLAKTHATEIAGLVKHLQWK